ncbi:helix-turn-helix domain-containing protein [Streptomyces olivaceus]|uniref:helix-turn-helix domain-containing protein n=1 Tax=Streptomyces olivaceus TaxID=47716 RepID=UPI0040576F7E
METSDTPTVQDVAAVVTSLKKEIGDLDLALTDVISYEQIALATAIPAATVQGLFVGDHVTREDLNRSFHERLQFLRETRRRPDGELYRPAEIAQAVGVSKEMVTKLLNGARKAGLDVSASLERFFEVNPGFFTISGEQALLTALAPTIQRVELLGVLRGRDNEGVSLRGSLTAGTDRLSEALRAEIAGRSRSEDPEISEIARKMRSLPDSRRSSVLRIIGNVLGLARTDDVESGSRGG